MKNGTGVSTRFSSTNQPSGFAKSEGWSRRKVKEDIMNTISSMFNMNYGDFLNMQKDIKQNPNKYTLQEKLLADFVISDRSIVHWLDMVVGKAKATNDDDSMFNNW